MFYECQKSFACMPKPTTNLKNALTNWIAQREQADIDCDCANCALWNRKTKTLWSSTPPTERRTTEHNECNRIREIATQFSIFERCQMYLWKNNLVQSSAEICHWSSSVCASRRFWTKIVRAQCQPATNCAHFVCSVCSHWQSPASDECNRSPINSGARRYFTKSNKVISMHAAVAHGSQYGYSHSHSSVHLCSWLLCTMYMASWHNYDFRTLSLMLLPPPPRVHATRDIAAKLFDCTKRTADDTHSQSWMRMIR